MARTFVYLLIYVFLPVFFAAAELSPLQAHHQPLLSRRSVSYTEPLSLFSVCDKEVRQLCPTQEKAPLKCLLRHLFEARQNTHITEKKQGLQPKNRNRVVTFSKECSSWLWAREECVSYVRMAGVCPSTESARDCLRRVPPRQLPSECRNTGYYRSVLLYGEMKKQQTKLRRDAKDA